MNKKKINFLKKFKIKKKKYEWGNDGIKGKISVDGLQFVSFVHRPIDN